MAIEMKLQSSLQMPRQHEVQKQGSQVDTPANVVSEAKKVSESNEEKAENVEQNAALNDIQDKVSQLNDHMQNLQRNLQFTVDERSGSSVITIRDTETEEVIRQFPSEEILNARSAVEQVKGLLIETKA